MDVDWFIFLVAMNDGNARSCIDICPNGSFVQLDDALLDVNIDEIGVFSTALIATLSAGYGSWPGCRDGKVWICIHLLCDTPLVIKKTFRE